MRKPIKIFYSPLSCRFYASQNYKIDGQSVVITGAKFDVTDDIAGAIFQHDIEFTRITPEAGVRPSAQHDETTFNEIDKKLEKILGPIPKPL